MSSPTTVYRARWVLPIDGRPIQNGCVTVSNGKIAGVGDHIPSGAVVSSNAVDLGDVAIVPGLVNCHTHLEFSLLTQPLDPRLPFPDWIRRVVAYRAAVADRVGDAIRHGVAESVRGGVTCLGEIATAGWTWADYGRDAAANPSQIRRGCPEVVVFQEFIGMTAPRITAGLEAADEFLQTTSGHGLSPHAPYSVAPEFWSALLDLAANANRPVAVHLAETAGELELLSQGTGEFRQLLESFGIWRPECFGRRSPMEWIQDLSRLSRAVVVHGNYLTIDELAEMARSPHLTLVYCPRTHAAFGHPPHPWRDLIALGGSVALGTDSRATNPDLDFWSELQFLAANTPDVPHHTILKLGTFAGATALGLRSSRGSLTVGKRADLAVISLDASTDQDPTYAILAPGNRVVGTVIAGEWAYDALGMSGSNGA